MKLTINQIAIVVNDYDEAIEFYTKKLLFAVIEDTVLSETKRWVVVAPENSTGCNLLLAKASGPEQKTRIGNQTGGRVFLFLHTDEFKNYYQHLINNDVKTLGFVVKVYVEMKLFFIKTFE